MTVPVQTTFTTSIANGATAVFPYTFKIAAENDLAVVIDGVLQESGYTVSGVGDGNGGDITFDVMPADGAKVLRFLKPIMWRETDYQQFGDWLSPVVNLEFDRVWLAMQTLQQNDLRSLKLPIDTTTDQELLDDAAARVGKSIKFDGDGNVILTDGDPDEAQTAAAAYAAAAAASAGTASGHASTASAQAVIAASEAQDAETARLAAETAQSEAEGARDETAAILASAELSRYAVAAQFAAHEAATPDMTVVVDAGSLMVAGTLVAQAAQTTAAFTAPVTHPRIDRIVIDQLTGAVEIVAGTEAAEPVAPDVPAGKLPIAQVALATDTTVITNSLITDERTSIAWPDIMALSSDEELDASANHALVYDAENGTYKRVALNKLGGGIVDYQVLTTGSGTWAKPAGLSARAMVRLQMWGSGASGAARATTGNASGGAAGTYLDFMLPASMFSATESFSVADAVAGVSGNTVGAAGESSSFTVGGVVLSTGASDGGYTAALGTGAPSLEGGKPTFGGELASSFGFYYGVTDGINWQSSSAPHYGVLSTNVPTAGFSMPSAGGGGNCSSASGGVRTGGGAFFGGEGGDGGAYTGGNGGDGQAPGGGGGGAVQGGTSGAGARGEIRVTVFD